MSAVRQAQLAELYQQARPRLIRVAYALLGSRAEAEDVVSGCWLRLVEADRSAQVRDVEAWGVVAVAHRALDVLRSARVRRETYVGPWLPEPLLGPAVMLHGPEDPADRVSLDDTVSYALLVVLETLTPAERTAWVLHDLFGVPFDEVARTVGRTPAAVRQLARRARQHVAAHPHRIEVAPAEHRATVAAFLRATGTGDLAGLLAVLDPDVVVTSDGGGEVTAARRPVHGADRAARFLLGVVAKVPAGLTVQPRLVNGLVGFAVLGPDRPVLVAALTVRDRRVTHVDLVRAPTKLASLDRE